MPTRTISPSPWRLIVRRLSAAAIVAAVLWMLYNAAWLGEPLHRLDEGVFYFLNGLLGHAGWFDRLIIFLNQRFVDYSIGALIALAYAVYTFRRGREKFWQRFKFGLVILSIMVPIIFINKGIGNRIGRYDPAEALAGSCVNLQVLYPGIRQHHVAARGCFPADHGIVVFSFVWITFYARRRRVPIVLLGAILLLIPRLVVGGHWLTDMLGAAVLAFILPSILDVFLRFDDPKWGLHPSAAERAGAEEKTRRIVPAAAN